jgi:hypothetical protein
MNTNKILCHFNLTYFSLNFKNSSVKHLFNTSAVLYYDTDSVNKINTQNVGNTNSYKEEGFFKETVNTQMLYNIVATRVVKTLQEINSDSFFLTYIPRVDIENFESQGIEYCKANLNERSHNIDKFVDVFQYTSIIFSAFLTANAMVQMHKSKLSNLAAGGSIFYTDTDSIITDLSMDKLKEVMSEKVGSEVGQLNFEYSINRGYFNKNKLYALLLNDGTIITKGKGFSTESLSLSEYEQMYIYSIKGTKIYSKTNYFVWSVFISNKKITID